MPFFHLKLNLVAALFSSVFLTRWLCSNSNLFEVIRAEVIDLSVEGVADVATSISP